MPKGLEFTLTASGTANINSAIVASAGLLLIGVGGEETGASPNVAENKIYHGSTVSGGTQLMPVLVYGAGEGRIDWLHPGIACPEGISIEKITGTSVVTLYTRKEPA